jgi:hypothetical protein
MKVRVDIRRLVLDGSMSRRERMALGEEIGRELTRLLAGGARSDNGFRGPPGSPVAAQIAAAVAARLPTQSAPRSTGGRS